MSEQGEQAEQIPLGGGFSQDTQSAAHDPLAKLSQVQRGVVKAIQEERRRLQGASGEEAEGIREVIHGLEQLAEDRKVPTAFYKESAPRTSRSRPRDWGAHLSDPDYHKEQREK